MVELWIPKILFLYLEVDQFFPEIVLFTNIFFKSLLKLIYLYNATPFRILFIDFEIAEMIEKNKLHLSGQESSKNKE